MKMKKALLYGLSFVLVAAVAISGTLAYLTSTDEDVNVMTLGNVSIEQHEQDRDGNNFVQGQTLMPYVTLGATEKEPVTVNGYEIEMRTKESVGNYIDKIVTVTNTGKTDAYVRTLIAIPAVLENEDASKNILHWNAVSDTDTTTYNGWMWDIENNKEWGARVYTTIDVEGIKYNVYVATNKNVIKAGEATAPSLVGIYLDSKVDYDGKKYTYDGQSIDYDFSNGVAVLVMSQAVQAEGFADAKTALDEGFGKVADKAAEWFDGMIIPVYAQEAEQVEKVFENGGELFLQEDISADKHTVNEGVKVDIDLQDNTLSGIVNNKGEMNVSGGKMEANYMNNYGDATFNDIEMKAGTSTDYANIGRANSVTEYNNVNIEAEGGAIGLVDGAEAVFNSGSVKVVGSTTNPRYNFYVVGDGTKLTINDGIFSFSSTTLKRSYIYVGAGATVTINGGTFGPASTRQAAILGDGKVIIKGGTFGFDPSAWLADGYEAVKDGFTWTVSAK